MKEEKLAVLAYRLPKKAVSRACSTSLPKIFIGVRSHERASTVSANNRSASTRLRKLRLYIIEPSSLPKLYSPSGPRIWRRGSWVLRTLLIRGIVLNFGILLRRSRLCVREIYQIVYSVHNKYGCSCKISATIEWPSLIPTKFSVAKYTQGTLCTLCTLCTVALSGLK